MIDKTIKLNQMDKPTHTKTVRYKVYTKGGALDGHLPSDTFDATFPATLFTKQEVEDWIQEEKQERKKDRWEGWREKTIIFVKETVHEDIEREVYKKVVLKPVFDKPTEDEYKELQKEPEPEPTPDWSGKELDTKKLEDASIYDLKGATILNVGFHPDATEGGLTFDYIDGKDGEKKRMVIGFNDMGLWTEYLGDCKC